MGRDSERRGGKKAKHLEMLPLKKTVEEA